MARATYVLDKTYVVEETLGIDKYLAVIPGTSDLQVKLTGAAAAGVVAGITQEAAKNGKPIVCRKMGISRATAAGIIARSAYVELAGSSGKLQSATLTAGTAAVHHIVGIAETASGADGDIFDVLMLNVPDSVALH